MPRPNLWIVVILFVVTLSGCGRDEPGRATADLGSGALRWGTFPVEVHADAFLLADSDAALDLRDAMDFWENKAGRHLFILVGGWDNSQLPYSGNASNPDVLLANVIFLKGPWPFDPRIAGKTIIHSQQGRIENAVILLNSDTHLCTDNCLGEESSVSRRKLLAHELGHFLGLGHAAAPSDIMYPEILPGGSLESLQVNQNLLKSLTQ